ncbi:hypothetical protein F2Q69_00048067 [Brassica cretica]|uniref:Uncharacterized protein n=1 Tax=Brassica cretica TaxID=69181 RepID=A0A8S9PPX4_BRACR|nr:hypothetical protein F2Q69_00048067 [Brassica cretica]
MALNVIEKVQVSPATRSSDDSVNSFSLSLNFFNSEESKMGLDVRMCNGNGLQGVSVGLAGSMIYAPTIKKNYVGRSKYEKQWEVRELQIFYIFVYVDVLP